MIGSREGGEHMTTFDPDRTVPSDDLPVSVDATKAASGDGHTSTDAKKRTGRTWLYVVSALILVVTLGLGYLIGYSTSGASNAKTQRNHAVAALTKAQQELTTAQSQLATAQSNLSAQKVRGTACSTYAGALEKTVTTGGALLQAFEDAGNSAPGSPEETAAYNRANQLYDQLQQEIGAAQALAPACKGSAL
jgi:hypothetical protein